MKYDYKVFFKVTGDIPENNPPHGEEGHTCMVDGGSYEDFNDALKAAVETARAFPTTTYVNIHLCKDSKSGYGGLEVKHSAEIFKVVAGETHYDLTETSAL